MTQPSATPAPINLLVTRHPAAASWLRKAIGDPDACCIDHIESWPLRTGDRLIGVLPLQLVARACAQGVECWLICVDTPRHLRGRELSEQELDQLGAKVTRVEVRLGEHWPGKATRDD